MYYSMHCNFFLKEEGGDEEFYKKQTKCTTSVKEGIVKLI